MENVHLLQSLSSAEGKTPFTDSFFPKPDLQAECVMLMLLGQWGWEFHRGTCKSSGCYTRWVTLVLALYCEKPLALQKNLLFF